MADFLNFKKGLLANLEDAAKQAGTIYVTTDERAMYVDVDNNTRIRLGDFIEVATEADLGLAKYQPYSTTALYYITEGNKLMKYSGIADGKAVFVQINSTKAVNDLITALTERVDTVESAASTNATNITNLTKTVGDNKSAAEKAVADVQANVNTLSNTVAANKTAIEGTVSALDARVISAESAITGLQSSKADKTTVEALDAAYKAADTAIAKDIADATDRIQDLEDAIGTGSGENSLSSRVEALETTTGGHTTAINSLNGDMTTAKSNISTLQKDLDTAEAQVAANKADIATNANNISALQTRAGTIEAAATELKGVVDGHTSTLATLNTNINKKADQTALNEEIAAREAADAALGERIDGVNTTVGGHTTKITALEAKDGELDTAIKANASAITTLSGDVSAMDTAYKAKDEELAGDIADLKTNKANKTDLNSAVGRIDTLETDLNAAEEDIAENAAAIASLSTNVADTYVTKEVYNAKVSTLESNDSTHNQKIAALEAADVEIKSAATALTTRVTNVETKASNNESAITALGTRVTTAEGKITALEEADEAIRAEIESKFKAADAMTFSGEVNSASAVAALKDVEAGNTYVATESFVLGENVVAVGDLIIASGVENDNGILDTVTWIHVPSGYVEAHENKLVGPGDSGNTVQLQSHTSAPLGSISFEAAENSSTTVTVSGTTATKVVIGMEWGSF